MRFLSLLKCEQFFKTVHTRAGEALTDPKKAGAEDATLSFYAILTIRESKPFDKNALLSA
jgi:hypothetical protein